MNYEVIAHTILPNNHECEDGYPGDISLFVLRVVPSNHIPEFRLGAAHIYVERTTQSPLDCIKDGSLAEEAVDYIAQHGTILRASEALIFRQLFPLYREGEPAHERHPQSSSDDISHPASL